jgi:hypothetical protein
VLGNEVYTLYFSNKKRGNEADGGCFLKGTVVEIDTALRFQCGKNVSYIMFP